MREHMECIKQATHPVAAIIVSKMISTPYAVLASMGIDRPFVCLQYLCHVSEFQDNNYGQQRC